MKLDASTSRVHQIKQVLLHAIEEQQINLLYQGQNNLRTKKLVGLEALCRIATSPWGNIMPDEFIPVAENEGLITPLERLVLVQLARDLPQLIERHPKIRVGVNLSIRHITASDFSTFIHHWLNALPKKIATCLDFEMTETYFQNISDNTINDLKELQNRGVRIVMDDFGSGQSSLSRLHMLPFDVIKLDKEFAQKIEQPMVHSIVKAMVNFSREFNIDLITEGVETTQQSQAIKTLGCEIAQGFLFSRPQPLAFWLNGYTDAGN